MVARLHNTGWYSIGKQLTLSFKFVLALVFCFAIHSVAIHSTHQSTKLNSHKHAINVKVEGARKGGRKGGGRKGGGRKGGERKTVIQGRWREGRRCGPQRGLCNIVHDFLSSFLCIFIDRM